MAPLATRVLQRRSPSTLPIALTFTICAVALIAIVVVCCRKKKSSRGRGSGRSRACMRGDGGGHCGRHSCGACGARGRNHGNVHHTSRHVHATVVDIPAPRPPPGDGSSNGDAASDVVRNPEPAVLPQNAGMFNEMDAPQDEPYSSRMAMEDRRRDRRARRH